MIGDPLEAFGDRRVALVTGGARRVGRAICLELGRAGCDVVLTHRSSADAAGSLVEALRAAGRRAASLELDLDDLDAVERVGGTIAQRLARLDTLVHNASLYSGAPLREIDAAHALGQYRVNALAPLLLTKRLAPLFAKGEDPSIVAMCDAHAGLGRPRRGFAAYSMSKAALLEMVQALAHELAPTVRVNGVAPGVVLFPDDGDGSSEAERERYLSRVPLARAGTPEDAARAVRFLALEAPYVTGQTLRVDGGRSFA